MPQLTIDERKVLSVIPFDFDGRGGAKLSSIAECSGFSKSKTWRILQRLVEKGEVKRTDVPYRNLFVSRYSTTAPF